MFCTDELTNKMSIAKEQASEQSGNLNGSVPPKEGVSSSTHVALKGAGGLDKSIDNANATNDLDNGNGTTDASAQDAVGTDGSGENISGVNAMKDVENSQQDPMVGMSFSSEEQAYNFYNTYARRKGFSVRKGHLSRRKDGSIRDRHLLCSNEGSRQPHRTHVTRKPRPLERTNCLARIELKVNADKRWVIHRFIDEHNHPLASPNKSFMLRSHKKKFTVQRAVFTESDFYYGVKPAPVQQLRPEASEGAGDVALFPKDHVTCVSAQRLRDFDKGDAQLLLDFLKVKQSEDPSFVYAVQLDEKERLTNCFWTDARSVVDYSYFGDAVTLETTYRCSRFDLPFAAFIGVNHHKQVIIFGAALLLDESVESFIWLFRTFLAAMSGRQPKTIFTDLSAAMSKAIAMTIPDTCHRLCLWHILNNASKLVQGVVSYEPSFRKDFENLIYGCNSEDDFCGGWDSLISKHGLASVPWFTDLFAARDRWSLVFCGNTFCSLMTTKKWSETMDSLFKLHFYRKLPLSKFMVQYFRALIHLRQEELLEDHESWQSKPVLLVDIPMLSEAAKSYTRTVYADFEYEYKSQLACVCERISGNGIVYSFRVSVPQKQCYGIVDFNPSDATVTCSCKKFDSLGILCMHALKVLNNNNILYLPAQYILKRWTKCAKDEQPPSGHQPVVDSESLSSKHSRICHKAVGIAAKSMLSKNALEILENGLDRFIEQMDSLMHNTSLSKPVAEVGAMHNMTENPLEATSICFDGFEFSAR